MKKLGILVVLFLVLFTVYGCGSDGGTTTQTPPVQQTITQPSPTVTNVSPVASLTDLEETLNAIYEKVNPSVVHIRVVQKVEGSAFTFPELQDNPFGFNFGFPEEPQEYYNTAEGSGFVWDREGHIVTNYHVVEGADEIEVTFYDGSTVKGEVIGTDPDSDLAVVKVDITDGLLNPVQLADSTQVKVGQLAVSIGNPFGLEGTMTVGFVSALGRLLPVDTGVATGSYNIPDVIQTDASLNPGNSGGVLVNNSGDVIGVPSAIISPARVSAGIGFAIPSAIVAKVVPDLIEDGSHEHPWLGISGMSLTPDLAEAMDLEPSQRGALIIDVLPDSPADEADLRGSGRQVTIDGEAVRVGGDVIVGMDGEPIKRIDDVITYLSRSIEVGQTVVLDILRDGEEMEVEVTLAARPSSSSENDSGIEGDAWLGIVGMNILPEIAEAMDLPSGQEGALVVQVLNDSPADEAGLRGSFKPIDLDGQEILVGGDVIIEIEGKAVDGMESLQRLIAQYEPDDEVTLTILRDGNESEIEVTLGERLG